MKSNILVFSLLLIPTFGPCWSQYCYPNYTNDCSSGDYIDGFEINTISNIGTACANPSSSNFSDYTSLSTTLAYGQSYAVTCTPGPSWGQSFGLWIDFNANQSFDDPNEFFDLGYSVAGGNVTTSINIPTSGINVTTRMRLLSSFGTTSVLPELSCGNIDWGEVEDYTINMTGGLDCTGYEGDTESDAILVSSIPYSHNYDNSICYTSQNLVYPSPDVYYLITPININSLDISLCGSSFDTFLTATDSQGNVIAINDDAIGCGSQSEMTVNTTAHDSIYIIVEGYDMDAGAYTLNINQGTIGVNEKSINESLIHPNPAKDYINIPEGTTSPILVYNSEGKIIFKTCASKKLDLPALKKGIYIVQFEYQNKLIRQKLAIL